MGLRFVHKRVKKNFVLPKISDTKPETKKVKEQKAEVVAKPKNKKVKKSKDMLTVEQVTAAEEAVEAIAPEVKRVKQDRGLIERTESSKIILTEDNRQVLTD